jgi:hypothetical protein
MRSPVASEITRIDRERVAAMTPDERVALVLQLSREGLASYMAVHQIDGPTARARIHATRRLGRPRSRSSEQG